MQLFSLTLLAVLANAPMIYAAGNGRGETIPSRFQEIVADQPTLVEQLVKSEDRSINESLQPEVAILPEMQPLKPLSLRMRRHVLPPVALQQGCLLLLVVHATSNGNRLNQAAPGTGKG
ncbi:hypothetical protein MCOR07_002001 [Pyricularia oryzae]|nr:hypothetical protein MCOR01_005622 [Pyricularia oryzae]KAI6371460.1 hypothetical protein MCOR31_004117 [Pyricularia oryzae]KAI6528519.1 hypothetical protein MCOR16_005340 [Pyricularia oryzae]KAI6568110.1 hypothetical protein MCOR09_005915 [Pyricularia oryzae]KAI6582456.1 hypothetical protein MCOR06_008570 [Pyricularia oryzae]